MSLTYQQAQPMDFSRSQMFWHWSPPLAWSIEAWRGAGGGGGGGGAVSLAAPLRCRTIHNGERTMEN
jgi:hypothetical protein